MLGQSIRQSFRLDSLLPQIIAGCGCGLLLGVALLKFSPLLVLGALAAAVFGVATLKRPEIGLLGILIATSSIIFENQLPMVSLGGISLHIPDLILLSLLGVILLRWLVEPGFKIVRTPLDWLFLIFFGVNLLSTFIAIFQSSVEFEEARRALRPMAYYLTFFIVTNLMRERRQLNLLFNGLFLLATIVAIAMVVQFLLGDSVHLLPGRVESLGTQGVTYGDVTRILPPGWSIILVSFVAILCILVLEKLKPLELLRFLQCGLMGMALLMTFLRSYWAALIFVVFLLLYFLQGHERQKLVSWGLMASSSVAMILLVVFSVPSSRATRLVGASTDRLSTLFRSGTFQGQDSSLNWRMIENGYALSTIASHPWIGLGMGGNYRPWDPRLDVPPAGGPGDLRWFIHNGYLAIMLHTGLIGFVSLIWLSLIFLVRGVRYWRSIADNQMRGVMLGFTLVYLTVLIAAPVNSTFVQWRWTPVIGIIMGANEVILSKFGGISR